jgi:hypothetical protein
LCPEDPEDMVGPAVSDLRGMILINFSVACVQPYSPNRPPHGVCYQTRYHRVSFDRLHLLATGTHKLDDPGQVHSI